MTDREKMAQIIAEHLCPQGKAHKTLYGSERKCYSNDNFAECEKVSKCVDALFEAGIGDVTEWKEKVECAKRILQIPTLPNGTTDLSYFEYKGERIQDIARQRDEYKHRAEVAERAVREFAAQVGCRTCPYKGRCEISNPSAENDYQECYEVALRIAEKDLTEEKKDDKRL